MRERVPSARTRGVAHLRRHRLILNKAGRDGTAKANVTPDGESSVWGAVYELHAESWARLDAFERGYARLELEVVMISGEAIRVQTYVAERLTGDLVPLASYKRRIVEGAHEHALPAAYVAMLEALPERLDPEAIS